MNLDKEYYERQIKGLILILSESSDPKIHRDYIIEKLNMIMVCGIGFHPSILEKLK